MIFFKKMYILKFSLCFIGFFLSFHIQASDKEFTQKAINNYKNLLENTDTWTPANKYDASHFFMLPMVYAFQNNNHILKESFDKQVERLIRSPDRSMTLRNNSERLSSLQYWMFLSEYNLLTEGGNKLLSNYLLNQIESFWLKEPAWQWGMKSKFPNLKQKMDWKLNNYSFKSYHRGIVDEELFLFATAANLNRIYPQNKTLLDIKNYAYKIFLQRSEFTSDGGWLFDKGSFDNHKDFAYAGYNTQQNIGAKKLEKDVVSDSSHFFRMPYILNALKNSYPKNSMEYQKFSKYRQALEKQFFSKVLVIKDNEIYLNNYMDGRNGLYRWNSANSSSGKGAAPYGLSYSFGMGWWTFLPGTKIKTNYANYFKQNLNSRFEKRCDDLFKLKQFNGGLYQCLYLNNSYLASKLNTFS